MAILKKDGSNYNVGGRSSLQSYRPGAQDIDLFDKLDQEQVDLAGSIVTYVKCWIDTDFDKLYMESINSTISQEGFRMKSVFTPIAPAQQMTPFGMDSFDEMIFSFNLTNWMEIVGEMPKIKSLILCEWDSTGKGGSAWEIIQNELGGSYKLWNKYRLSLICKKYQPSRGDRIPTVKGNESINIF